MATAPPRGKPMKGDCYVANGRLALDTLRGLGPLKKYKDKVALIHGVVLNNKQIYQRRSRRALSQLVASMR